MQGIVVSSPRAAARGPGVPAWLQWSACSATSPTSFRRPANPVGATPSPQTRLAPFLSPRIPLRASNRARKATERREAVPGRKPQLDFTPSVGQYTTTVGGKFHRLGTDQAEAERQFRWL